MPNDLSETLKTETKSMTPAQLAEFRRQLGQKLPGFVSGLAAEVKTSKPPAPPATKIKPNG